MAGNDWLQQFVDDGTISADQLAEAISVAAAGGIMPEDALVKMGYVDEGRIGEAKAAAFGFNFTDLDNL